MKREKFYVTTPIYYVNAEPHIGHAYTTILADVLARYYRLMGLPVRFLTGTDEHGQKVQQAAAKAGVSPREHADEMVVRFLDLWKKLEITNDDFIRTTEERHTGVVRGLLANLYEKGEIYRAEYDGWYCVACERFFNEKDLNEGKCPEPGCGRTVERIGEANYFLRMSNYQDWLIRYIDEHPKFIQPDFRRNETLGFLRKKLNDLCISRPKSRLAWGIELPFDAGFVTYVWFDALVNYISAIGCLTDEAKFAKWWPASYHLIGKDILTTHTVYWPIMLKAMGLPMPECIFAHGWWLVGESKMSKTTGNVVNPMDFAGKYGVEAFRYFLLAEMVLGQDAAFTEEAFVRRYNTDLANDLGNLLSRLTKMVGTYCAGVIPEAGEEGADEKKLREVALAGAESMAEALENMRIDLGIGAVTGVVREANRYIDSRQPWRLAKEPDKRSLHTVLYYVAEVLRIVSGLLYPVMPLKMAELRAALGIGTDAPDMSALRRWGELKPGAKVGETRSLFPRIEDAAPAESGKGQGAAAPAAGGEKPKDGIQDTIAYADFGKVDMRTAKVLAAEKVPGADKLLRLEIELAGERRQIVAGIALHYQPEQMIGKTIVVVANLQPAKIRGVESKGMLLAAVDADGRLRVVTVDGEMSSGVKVK